MKLDLEFRDDVMPMGVTPLEAVVMVKCLDEEDNVTWFQISTPDLNSMECFGMLMSAVAVQADTIKVNFIPSDGEGNEET